MFDVWGFGWVWVGLGHGSISSPVSGLDWVDENRPTDNSELTFLFKPYSTVTKIHRVFVIFNICLCVNVFNYFLFSDCVHVATI